MYNKHKKLLDKIQKQYEVPGNFLIAFWGLETNYGQYTGTFKAINALATLAYDKRRRNFFTKELLSMLRLIANKKIPPHANSSWAGAMGFSQFMPSNIEKYAIDADNDDKLALWESLDDVFTSSANFLKNIGWQAGQKWGREVGLPVDFNYELTNNLKNTKTVTEWGKLGIMQNNGQALPKSNISAALLLPQGFLGPAFLVYPNFYAILNWNRSIHYALSVGILSDRILGLERLKTPRILEPALTLVQLKIIQQKLTKLNYYTGEIDGLVGPKTRLAIKLFQKNNHLVADSYVNIDIFNLLTKNK